MCSDMANARDGMRERSNPAVTAEKLVDFGKWSIFPLYGLARKGELCFMPFRSLESVKCSWPRLNPATFRHLFCPIHRNYSLNDDLSVGKRHSTTWAWRGKLGQQRNVAGPDSAIANLTFKLYY